MLLVKVLFSLVSVFGGSFLVMSFMRSVWFMLFVLLFCLGYWLS